MVQAKFRGKPSALPPPPPGSKEIVEDVEGANASSELETHLQGQTGLQPQQGQVQGLGGNTISLSNLSAVPGVVFALPPPPPLPTSTPLPDTPLHEILETVRKMTRKEHGELVCHLYHTHGVQYPTTPTPAAGLHTQDARSGAGKGFVNTAEMSVRTDVITYFTIFSLVFPCFTLFYLVLPCFTLFYLVLPCFKPILFFYTMSLNPCRSQCFSHGISPLMYSLGTNGADGGHPSQ